MNKRSAIAVAGGLTGALVSGVAGYSVRVHSAPVASDPATTKPIIKTKTKTITIHKKAKAPAPVAHVAPAAAVQTVVVHRAPHVVHLPTRPAPPPAVHHTGGSTHGGSTGGEHESEHDHESGGEHDGGGGD